MSSYTPIYTKPYSEGFVNAPPYETPITAEVMDAYDSALENIESYLAENPIGSGDAAMVDASVSYGTLIIQLCNGDGKIISEKRVILPNVDLTNGVTHAVVYNLISMNDISMYRKAGTTVGPRSVAAGSDVTASGYGAHAEGEDTEAAGEAAHAEGKGTKALANYSHAEGQGTIAAGESQHVQGKNNVEDADGKYVHIVGNGSSDTERSNAHTLDWEGNAWYNGTVESAGIILTDTADSTKRYIVQITDGQLAVSEVTA